MSVQASVYIALGTNLGDRLANLREAVRQLRAHIAIEHVSSVYETEPAYVADQPRFLNAALSGTTILEPATLLHVLKTLERELGRVPGVRYGPRLIDLDILIYGDLVLKTPELTIPHPRIAERPFVLVPLAEIAGDITPPGWSRTITEAVALYGQGDVIARLGALGVEGL
jgi:2-amino-4-hydroxy-6-hydroxymethyldihydropteridine diphosphokinase